MCKFWSDCQKMQLAICDDESFFRDKLKKLLIEYKTRKRIHMDIFEYESGEELLSSEKIFDIVFMDYQMTGINGLETARLLRLKNTICNIIFVTSFPEFILDSFEVQPFRFMLKPLQSEKIYEAIDSYIKQQKLLYPLIVIENGIQKTVNAQDIIYLEGDGKYCIVRTTMETIHCSKTIAQVYSLLPEHCFYRIHKSYVVNMYCIASFDKNIITLNNGESAIVGRNHIAEFKKVYMSFVKNYYVRI